MVAAASEVVQSSIATQPDIGYAPNYEKYLARTEKRLANEHLRKDLPPGFPESLNSSLVWEGKDVAEKSDWLYELSPDDRQEIEDALQYFKGP
jgi:hypothetical protein